MRAHIAVPVIHIKRVTSCDLNKCPKRVRGLSAAAAPAAKSLKALSEIAAVRFPLFQIFGDAKIGGRIAPRRPHKIVNVSTAAMHTPCPR
jgi:hypothetical protein